MNTKTVILFHLILPWSYLYSKNILLNTNPAINSHSKSTYKIQQSTVVIPSQDDNKLTKNAVSFEEVNHGIQSGNEVENNGNLNSNKMPHYHSEIFKYLSF